MSNLREKALIGLGIGLGVSAITGVWYRYYLEKQKQKNAPPTNWRRVGTLSEIHFFPIKSCGGITLTETICGAIGIFEGLVTDRSFMLIDDDDNVVTARTYPHMFHIQPKIENNIITLTAPEMEPTEIRIKTLRKKPLIEANIFGQKVQVVECSDILNRWFTKYVTKDKLELRLVYYPYSVATKRNVDKKLMNGIFSNADTGALHDCSSYMLINETSVIDLNSRLKKPIESRQFRPSLIIKTTGPPYEEDSWEWIKIGEYAKFRNVCPCYRCILPNINPITAERSTDFQPLAILKSYRKDGTGESPVMGIQLGLKHPGIVRLGDEVFVGVPT